MFERDTESRGRPTARTGGVPRPGTGLRRAGGGILAAVVLAGCGQGQAEGAEGLSTAEVVRRDLEITAEATGQLEPLRAVEIKSRASGQVIEVAVDTGDEVEPGTLLVRVDPRDVQNEYDQTEADYEVAQERLRNAEAQFERSRNLLEAEVITEQEHEGRSLDYANARSQAIRAETALNLARMRLEDVEIRSGMTGTVLERLVEEGQVISSASGSVSEGTLLMTVASLGVMEVRTLVDETDVGRIRAGMPVNVVVDAYPDEAFEGQVEKVEPQATVESNVVAYPVIVHLENPEGILRPGMSVEVTVLLAERPDALALPNNAIVAANEVAAAGSVLGVSEEYVEVDRGAFQELRRELAGGSQANGASDASDAASGGRDPDAEARAAMREAVRSGDREALGEMMERGELPAGAGAMRARAGGRGGSGSDDVREGVVFVVDAAGEVRPRPVLLGVNDWSNSEILAGLEEGEQVALIGGAQLQEQQESWGGRGRSAIPFGR